mgnify:CR=1 FL=1
MPIDVVTSFISAIERKDLEHALTHLTDDCEYDNVPMGKVFGRDAGVRVVHGERDFVLLKRKTHRARALRGHRGDAIDGV